MTGLPIRRFPLGCKDGLVKHLLSFRRSVFMVLKEDVELSLVFKFTVEDCDHSIYVSSDTDMKCFR